jgi:hypothetical protein
MKRREADKVESQLTAANERIAELEAALSTYEAIKRNGLVSAEGWDQLKVRIEKLETLLRPFAKAAEHLPPWAKDDDFVNIDKPYESEDGFDERWLIDDRIEMHHFKDAAAALAAKDGDG